MKTLFVSWQDPITRSWYPIGMLSRDSDGFEFAYTRGAQMSENFQPLIQFKELDKRYRSEELFPVFANRLMNKSRAEYESMLEWLNLSSGEADPIQILAVSEGRRMTDDLCLFPRSDPNKNGDYVVNFFSHGIRYLDDESLARVSQLRRGEKLFLIPDEGNEHDSYALSLETGDLEFRVGFCPRFLVRDLHWLLAETGPNEVEVSVERVNPDAPLQLRLLCRVVAPWPESFEPFSSEEFQLLA